MLSKYTSESVSEGHPDKLCDKIADSVLDACLADDPHSRVACEVFSTTGLVLIGGEITTETFVDIQEVARTVAKEIGYTRPEYGLDADSMAVINTIHAQSPDIAQGVNGTGLAEYAGNIGAGDQGIMYGFACDETAELMPAPITYAHAILKTAEKVRKNSIKWLRPDAKAQVTVVYDGYKPVRIDTIVLSHQHDPDISQAQITECLRKEIIEATLGNTGLLDKDTVYFINPTGRFVTGGPQGDTGLTGRKIIVDTYGGMAHHGGGAFSGKDATKVDRSASYMARYVAKNIVAAGIAHRCEIQLAYAIGVPFPVSIYVQTFGTSEVSDEKLIKAIQEVFDLSPSGIIKTLDLLKPIYAKTTNYGHFGRNEFTWEKLDKVDALKKALNA
ncbi:MAG: methionine adenosyltransferase [Spirochaetaceae bacterium]|nr:methionine adenosyltransferase [Spirochaetaceae bacterium]